MHIHIDFFTKDSALLGISFKKIKLDPGQFKKSHIFEIGLGFLFVSIYIIL